MKNFRSCALWAEGLVLNPRDDNMTTDEHSTEEEAQAVCRTLEEEGYGGEGIHFPIRTWVEEIDIGMEEVKTVKCLMKKYSTRTMEPPHEFDTVGEFEIEDIDPNDDGGTDFYHRLRQKCIEHGEIMRFYSISRQEGYKYEVTVYGEFERTPKYKKQELSDDLRFGACLAHARGHITLEDAKAIMDIPNLFYPNV